MSIVDIYEMLSQLVVDFLPLLYFLVLIGILYLCAVGIDTSYNKYLLSNLQAAENWLNSFESKKMDREFRETYYLNALNGYVAAKISYENGIPKWLQITKILMSITISFITLGYLGVL